VKAVAAEARAAVAMEADWEEEATDWEEEATDWEEVDWVRAAAARGVETMVWGSWWARRWERWCWERRRKRTRSKHRWCRRT
jgi:hypothetical protein